MISKDVELAVKQFSQLSLTFVPDDCSYIFAIRRNGEDIGLVCNMDLADFERFIKRITIQNLKVAEELPPASTES